MSWSDDDSVWTGRITKLNTSSLLTTMRLSVGVCDESSNQWLAGRCAAKPGMACLEGIEKAKQLHPDLIVLDLSMPRLNGLDAARVLSKIIPKVPLLMYSAHMDKFVEKEAIAAGVTAVLPKAANVDTLVGQVQVLLGTD